MTIGQPTPSRTPRKDQIELRKARSTLRICSKSSKRTKTRMEMQMRIPTQTRDRRPGIAPGSLRQMTNRDPSANVQVRRILVAKAGKYYGHNHTSSLFPAKLVIPARCETVSQIQANGIWWSCFVSACRRECCRWNSVPPEMAFLISNGTDTPALRLTQILPAPYSLPFRTRSEFPLSNAATGSAVRRRCPADVYTYQPFDIIVA